MDSKTSMITVREHDSVTSYDKMYYALCGDKIVRLCDGKIIKEIR